LIGIPAWLRQGRPNR